MGLSASVDQAIGAGRLDSIHFRETMSPVTPPTLAGMISGQPGLRRQDRTLVTAEDVARGRGRPRQQGGGARTDPKLTLLCFLLKSSFLRRIRRKSSNRPLPVCTTWCRTGGRHPRPKLVESTGSPR